MKLKKTIGIIALATLFASTGASAVEKSIIVTASVDSSIDFLQSDGSPLPNNVTLNYSPANGGSFDTYTTQAAVHTNATDKDVLVKLLHEPMLTHTRDGSQIPMTVTLGNKQLGTTDTTLSANSMNYGANGLVGVSTSMPLSITASSTSGSVNAGTYQGIVSIVLTQSTQQPTP